MYKEIRKASSLLSFSEQNFNNKYHEYTEKENNRVNKEILEDDTDAE